MENKRGMNERERLQAFVVGDEEWEDSLDGVTDLERRGMLLVIDVAGDTHSCHG